VVTVVTFRSLYSPGNRDLACRCALHWDRQDSPPVQRSWIGQWGFATWGAGRRRVGGCLADSAFVLV